MTKEERIERATKRAKEIMSRILDVYATRDFVEIVGQEGGDTLTFRFYDDGKVYER